VLFGLRHNVPDEVVAEVFGCSQATITRYHDILQSILRGVPHPEVDQRLEQTRRDGVLVDGVRRPGLRTGTLRTLRRRLRSLLRRRILLSVE